ncbi:jg10072 [Pararge aegeria aegeria]|uniref:Jg10072 protein n=1 Tax=Pararge aegeria aegeria TaxID=348720 RepID=A0A8S4SG74_9NEOP|nr:jg10072 [Pararge aegeria aegeria]
MSVPYSNTTDLKHSLSVPMLGQLAASAMLICFVGYQATTSENIGQSVYCSGWERGLATTPGVRATLLIVASRARKPLVLAAGGLFDLSLASYTTVRLDHRPGWLSL